MTEDQPTAETVVITSASRSALTPREVPRPRAAFRIEVMAADVHYRVRVIHDDNHGDFEELCVGKDEVGKYLRGLDAGAFPAEIEWPKGWEHYR